MRIWTLCIIWSLFPLSIDLIPSSSPILILFQFLWYSENLSDNDLNPYITINIAGDDEEQKSNGNKYYNNYKLNTKKIMKLYIEF